MLQFHAVMMSDPVPPISVQSRPKLSELESNRGLVALLVFFHHIPKLHALLDNVIVPQLTTSEALLGIILVVTTVIWFSHYVYTYGESPFRALSRKYVSNKTQ